MIGGPKEYAEIPCSNDDEWKPSKVIITYISYFYLFLVVQTSNSYLLFNYKNHKIMNLINLLKLQNKQKCII